MTLTPSRASSGRPEGVPAKGRGLAISLFDSEEDRRQGDEALSSMTPPGSSGHARRAPRRSGAVAATGPPVGSATVPVARGDLLHSL